MPTAIDSLCMGCMSESGGGACPRCGFDEGAYVPSPHQLPPRTILNGKYLLGRVLGEGGFGITYIGWDLNLDVKVAIKEYYPTGFVTRETTATSTVQPFTGSQGEFFTKGRGRFIDEAKSLAKFRSMPGIVSVSDFFTENGTAYIVMEYIDGQTFKAYLSQMGGRLPAGQVFDMLRPVMSSLAVVHRNGMIHRDISPDNIMISNDGYVKLLDFGAARDFGDSGNKSLSVMLKPGYAPEEQYRSRGKQGPWTDIYALSATMYKIITGTTPDESTERLRRDEVRRPSELGVAIDPGQEAALMRGMAVLAENRFQNIEAFLLALYPADVVVTVPVMPQPVPVPVPTGATAPIQVKNKNTSKNPQPPSASPVAAVGMISTLKNLNTPHKLALGLSAAGLLLGLCLFAALGSPLLFIPSIGGPLIVLFLLFRKDKARLALGMSVVALTMLFALGGMLYINGISNGTQALPEFGSGLQDQNTETPTMSPASAPEKNTSQDPVSPSIPLQTQGTEQEPSPPQSIRGNSATNLANGGYIAHQDGWVYFVSYDDGFSIYKMTDKGAFHTKLNDDFSEYINVVDEWVYYQNWNDDYKIYRVSTDGTDLQKLNDNKSSYLAVVDDWIYYQNGNDKWCIYKMRTDGSQQQKINEDMSGYMVIEDDWIYYRNGSEDGALYKIRTDGTGREKLDEGRVTPSAVIDGWLYYSFVSADGLYEEDTEYSICKIRTDGTGRQILHEAYVADMVVADGWIYYTTNEYDEDFGYDDRIYKIRIDGTGLARLTEYSCSRLGISGDWLYYCNSDEFILERMRIDGTHREPLE